MRYSNSGTCSSCINLEKHFCFIFNTRHVEVFKMEAISRRDIIVITELTFAHLQW